jgi:hypothetical protein
VPSFLVSVEKVFVADMKYWEWDEHQRLLHDDDIHVDMTLTLGAPATTTMWERRRLFVVGKAYGISHNPFVPIEWDVLSQ